MPSPTILSDAELIKRVIEVLPTRFLDSAPREEKWRTTEQLANELELFGADAVNRLDQCLRDHEAEGKKRMARGDDPERAIRRAKYPDRTTALPLWGSTERHKQPWPRHDHHRTDPPEDIPASLRVPDGAPRVFLSHAKDDAAVALRLAESLATMGIGSWMFETHIAQRNDIADCVRTAINEADMLVAFLTRNSIASLWVLTELHTSVASGKAVTLVVDADDSLLLRVLMSARFSYPNADFDESVKYNRKVVELLRQDYESRHQDVLSHIDYQGVTRVERYTNQVGHFMSTLPLYLGQVREQHRVWRPALAFPKAPARWKGFIKLSSIDDLRQRLGLPRT